MDSTLEKPQSIVEKQTYHILIVEDSDGKRVIPLNSATYSLGRDPSNTIQLNDRAASRHHFMLIRMSGSNPDSLYRIVDGDATGKASLNGITVNGVACTKRDLESGDTITLGAGTTLQYLVQTLTPQEFHWHYQREVPMAQAYLDPSSDPVMTMTTILSC